MYVGTYVGIEPYLRGCTYYETVHFDFKNFFKSLWPLNTILHPTLVDIEPVFIHITYTKFG